MSTDHGTAQLCLRCSRELLIVDKDELLYNFTLYCGHKFHKECLREYITDKQSKDSEDVRTKVTCPECKIYVITEEEILRLAETEIDLCVLCSEPLICVDKDWC